MPFSEATSLRQKRKEKTMIIAHLVAPIVEDALHLIPGFAESVVLFLLCHFHFEYLRGFFVKILLRSEEQENVKIRSKEHLHYYAIFRSYFPPPKEEGKDDDNCTSRCSDCRGCIAPDTRFCRKCGAFPVVPLSL